MGDDDDSSNKSREGKVGVSKLNDIKKTRAYVRSKITSLCTKIHEEISSISLHIRDEYVVRLSGLKAEVSELDRQFIAQSIENGHTDEQIEQHAANDEVYETKISLALSVLRSLGVTNPVISSSARDVVISDNREKLKLPFVQLPKFSNGKGEGVDDFFRSLESILDKHNLSEHEKYVYLRDQLKGDPLDLVESLDVSEQQYKIAKKLLYDAFETKLESKHKILNLSQKLAPS